jgi:hypothetical protein
MTSLAASSSIPKRKSDVVIVGRVGGSGTERASLQLARLV